MDRDCPKKPSPPSRLRVISDVASLTLTTVVLLGVLVASYLASVGGGPLFQNTTAQVSNKYFTQVNEKCKMTSLIVTSDLLCTAM